MNDISDPFKYIHIHTKTLLFIVTTRCIYSVNNKKPFMTTQPPPPNNQSF